MSIVYGILAFAIAGLEIINLLFKYGFLKILAIIVASIILIVCKLIKIKRKSVIALIVAIGTVAVVETSFFIIGQVKNNEFLKVLDEVEKVSFRSGEYINGEDFKNYYYGFSKSNGAGPTAKERSSITIYFKNGDKYKTEAEYSNPNVYYIKYKGYYYMFSGIHDELIRNYYNK